MILIDYLKEKLHDKRFLIASKYIAEKENSLAENLKCKELSKEEIFLVKKTWKDVINNIETGINGFKLFRHLNGFDPEYIPFGYFFPWMVRILSPIDAARTFANKGMTYTYFHNIKQPELVVRKIHDCILDKNNNTINEDKIIACIKNAQEDVIVKQSLGSFCGKSIQIIHKGTSNEDISKILKGYQGDYVIQKVLKQSVTTSRFNETSLNTFRIATLLLNGKFSVCASMLRFGSPDSVVDNVSAGGACVGVQENGKLMPFGVTKNGEKIFEWNGLKFEDLEIPEYQKLVDAARKAHYDIPLCAFVGWDFAIDNQGEVNLIEANIESPGLLFLQLSNARPAFGERFNEVLEYVKSHPLPLLPLYDATN